MNLFERRARAAAAAAGVTLLLGSAFYHTTARAQGERVREITVRADRFAFSPAELPVVEKGDLVKITFTAVDMPHSFTIDSYRIAKRAGAGQTITFEFRADQTGEHPVYCNLAQDDRCRQMKGTLVVR